MTTSAGNPSCPLVGTSIPNYEIDLRYIGRVSAYSVNGNTINSNTQLTIPCGSKTVTISVPSTEGASNFDIYFPPNGTNPWTGTTFQGAAGGGANTIFTLQTDDGSQPAIQIGAGRSDVPVFRTYSPQVNLVRPTLGGDISQIQGDGSLCVSSSQTYSLTGTSGASVNWTSTGSISINGSTTGSSVNVAGTGTGTGTLTATVSNCASTLTRTRTIGVGIPNISDVTVDNVLNPGPVAVNTNTTHYVHSTSSNIGNGLSHSFSVVGGSGDMGLNITGANGGDCEINISGTIGSRFLRISVNTNCGSNSRDVVFYIPSGYRMYSNPVKDKLTVEFANADLLEALPDQIEIVSEKEQKTVKSANIKDIFTNKRLKNGNSIEFDIRELPRGIYYLRVTNSRQTKDRQVEMTRLIFE